MQNVFPVACSDFNVLLRLGVDRQRVDVVGKVVKQELDLSQHFKCELSLKDESNKEFLVSIWGEAMVTQARTISVGDVVQVDNVILQRQTLTGTIAGR